MDIKTLNRANKLFSLIQKEKARLNESERIFQAEEVRITSSATTAALTLSGDEKIALCRSLTKRTQDALTAYQEEFDSL